MTESIANYPRSIPSISKNELCPQSAFHVRFTKGIELMEEYPDYVPVMFSTTDDVILEKKTVMCPKNASLCNVIMQFRKNLITADNSPTTGFIFYINLEDDKKILPKITENIGSLHEKYHGSDMWLTIKIEKENIFG
jgi:hypothetical protein